MLFWVCVVWYVEYLVRIFQKNVKLHQIISKLVVYPLIHLLLKRR